MYKLFTVKAEGQGERMAISDELKAAREKLGLTQPEFAKKLGVPHRSVQDWLYGRRIPKPLTQEGIRSRLKKMLDE